MNHKKDYNGCLSALLPIWLAFQVLSMVSTVFYASELGFSTITFAALGVNLLAMVGIILLLNFKKSGFFVFIAAHTLAFCIGLAFSEQLGARAVLEPIFGLILFLFLLNLRSKKTQLTGYQTLSLSEVDEVSPNGTAPEPQLMNQSTTPSFPLDEPIIAPAEPTPPLEQPKNDISNVCNQLNLEEHPQDIFVERNESAPQTLESEAREVVDIPGETKDETSLGKKSSHVGIIALIAVFIILLIAGIVYFFLRDGRTDKEKFEYAKGLIENHEYTKGVYELERIQEKYIPAKALLGKLYTQDDSVPNNYKRGEILLREACEQNDSSACWSLCLFYLEHGEIDSLETIAMRLLELNHPKGVRALMYVYWSENIHGKSNKFKDYKKVEYYALQTAENDPYACNYLGQIYSKGGDGVDKNFKKAFYWWDKGAKLGDTPDAMCYSNLGWLYWSGYGVAQNNKKAYESFIKSIKIAPKDDYSYYKIYLMWKYGDHRPYNADSARYYLKKAAECGNEEAAVELANINSY